MSEQPTLVSLFAGIGGFDLGMERAGVRPVGMCEIDPHARSILERHWPDVPKHDDIRTLKHDTFAHPDIVTFGSPCQDLSQAGNRAGLSEGTRSGLFINAVRYIREVQEASGGRYPRVAVWENVPGAFSSNRGRDFATVLTLMVGGEVRVPAGGWSNTGVAFGPEGSAEWRVVDSRYWGVAQRRRRVFLVHRPGSDRAGAVLLESEGVLGHPTPSGEARQDPRRDSPRGPIGRGGEINGGVEFAPRLAPTLSRGSGGSAGHQYRQAGNEDSVIVAPAVLASWGHHGRSSPRGDGSDPIVPVAYRKARRAKDVDDYETWQRDDVANTLNPHDLTGDVRSTHAIVSPALTARDAKGVPSDATMPLVLTGDGVTADPISANEAKTYSHEGSTLRMHNVVGIPTAFTAKDHGQDATLDLAPTLRAMGHTESHANGGGQIGVAASFGVRRLTPRECERLQGFPDDCTALTPDGKPIADANRYRTLGNAVTVNVTTWIGERIVRDLQAS